MKVAENVLNHQLKLFALIGMTFLVMQWLESRFFWGILGEIMILMCFYCVLVIKRLMNG